MKSEDSGSDAIHSRVLGEALERQVRELEKRQALEATAKNKQPAMLEMQGSLDGSQVKVFQYSASDVERDAAEQAARTKKMIEDYEQAYKAAITETPNALPWEIAPTEAMQAAQVAMLQAAAASSSSFTSASGSSGSEKTNALYRDSLMELSNSHAAAVDAVRKAKSSSSAAASPESASATATAATSTSTSTSLLNIGELLRNVTSSNVLSVGEAYKTAMLATEIQVSRSKQCPWAKSGNMPWCLDTCATPSPNFQMLQTVDLEWGIKTSKLFKDKIMKPIHKGPKRRKRQVCFKCDMMIDITRLSKQSATHQKKDAQSSYADTVYSTVMAKMKAENQLKVIIDRRLPGTVVTKLGSGPNAKPAAKPVSSPPLQVTTITVCANEESPQFMTGLVAALHPNYATMVRCRR